MKKILMTRLVGCVLVVGSLFMGMPALAATIIPDNATPDQILTITCADPTNTIYFFPDETTLWSASGSLSVGCDQTDPTWEMIGIPEGVWLHVEMDDEYMEGSPAEMTYQDFIAEGGLGRGDGLPPAYIEAGIISIRGNGLVKMETASLKHGVK